MNLNVIRAEKEPEDFLLSITKNCETLIEQTQRKVEETLEIKMTKPREAFQFTQPNEFEADWMLGFTSLEVYNSILKYNRRKKNKFQLYADTLDSEFSFNEMKDKIAELLDLSHITSEDLKHKTTRPDNIQALENYPLKRGKSMVIFWYYWFLLNHHFEILRLNLEFQLV